MKDYRRCFAFLIFFFTLNLVTSSIAFNLATDFRGNANQLEREEDNASKEAALKLPSHLSDAIHGVKMGISSDMCDNAVDKLEVDWDGNPVNHTCYHPKRPLLIMEEIESMEECYVPKGYYPKHVCMTEKISYDNDLPTYGSHRPLWPVYGEYIYLPPQRWLHNLEHGSIVMLYHPCTEPLEVERLRRLLKGCLRRYIITPEVNLPINRPLAVLSWGCKLLMNTVDKNAVTEFIKKHALHAPEGHLAKQGQYTYKLLRKSHIVRGSNYEDSHLCPQFQAN